jgi:hypothetical protein
MIAKVQTDTGEGVVDEEEQPKAMIEDTCH